MTSPRRRTDLDQMQVIGVDCATDPKNVGLALAEVGRSTINIREVAVGETETALDRWILDRLPLDQPVLLALDAPLGWPEALGALLASHTAGAPAAGKANRLFRRSTDDCIYDELGKRPLDVGADRIARCAHAALSLLARVRRASGRPIPLAWTPGVLAETSCIEVYPAATLVSRGISSKGYKGKDGVAARAQILATIQGEVRIAKRTQAQAEQIDHVLDAVLCTVAAADFLRADVIGPHDPLVARREGWIWARPRPASLTPRS